MIRRVVFMAVMAVAIGYVRGQNTSSFHTIGYAYQRPSPMAKVCASDTMDVEDYTDDEGNVCEPSVGSMKVYLHTVSLPLRHITITSPFGMRRDPLNRGRMRYHAGLDLRAHYEKVYSVLPGVVTAAAYSKSGGNYITVSHGICSCSYLHLSRISVWVGQHVKAGQCIGVSGNTGSRTTGAHLHLSCRMNDGKRKYFNPLLLLGFVSEQLLDYKPTK